MGSYVAEERETHIDIDYFGKTITIYTNYPTVIRRMEKAGFIPNKKGTYKGKIVDCTFVLPISKMGKFLKMNLLGYRPIED